MNALDLLYLTAAVLTAPLWARKHRMDWPQRLGRTPQLPTKRSPRLLVHAVSVGEVASLAPLVPLLRNAGTELVISATTDTGIARARELYSKDAAIVRYPLDLSSAVNRFLDAVRPDAIALTELELWPNFLSSARKRGIPVCVVSGRLSANSFRNYARFRPVLRRMFESLAFVAAQDRTYAGRFVHMGAHEERVHVTGSMKWDTISPGSRPDGPSADARALAEHLGIDPTKPLIVAGSTGPLSKRTSEEALIRDATPFERFPGLQLLIAPRKPERFEQVFAHLGGSRRCSRYTRPTALPAGAPRVFLLDTLGKLAAAYELASIAVVGRTFGSLGGSDPIQPIALGVPTVTGPGYHNFQTITDAFKGNDAIVETPKEDLPRVLTELLEDRRASAEKCSAIIDAGARTIEQHRGASRRTADLLLHLVR